MFCDNHNMFLTDLRRGAGKISSKEKVSDRSGNELWGWDGDDDIEMTGFKKDLDGEDFLDGNYTHIVGIDVDKIHDHMKANRDNYEIFPLYEDVFFENAVIDKTSLNIIAGSIIDFKKEMIGESFVINNPKASSSCGCGLSFSV